MPFYCNIDAPNVIPFQAVLGKVEKKEQEIVSWRVWDKYEIRNRRKYK